MEDITHDRDVNALEPAEGVADREEVEQRLSRVLVLAVPGVDHVSICQPCHELGRSDRRVANHDHVRVVRAQRQRGVLERLTLVDGRARRAQGHGVGRQALRGEFEARQRPRRGLVEEVDDRAAAQCRQLLHVAVERPRQGAGSVEDPFDVLAHEIGHGQQMTAWRPRRRTGWIGESDVRHRSPLRVRGSAALRPPRPPPRAGPARVRRARSAGSCRRSRVGSEARDGRGQRVRRAGRKPGARSRSSASIAARMVRPV